MGVAKRDGFNSIVRYMSLCFVARFILFSTVMSCVVGSSLARIGLPRSCCKANVIKDGSTSSKMVKDDQTLPNMVWCLEVVFFIDTHHMMKTEKPTKTRKVQLIPIMANVQKLISPSPETELDIKIFI